MLTLPEIRAQTRPHISALCEGLDLSTVEVLHAYDWVCDVIYDDHRVYEPYDSIKRSNVEHFFEIWCDDFYVVKLAGMKWRKVVRR
jgi:hypothetical protein